MSEKDKPSSKLVWVVLSGVVSLVVGVSSSLMIDQINDNTAILIFNVTSLESFPGEAQKLGIIALHVENKGGKEVEEVKCRIEMRNAKLKEPRISGLSAASPKIHFDESYFEISIPFLNPKEEFSLQLLVEPDGDALEVPIIDIRGKGVVGTEVRNTAPSRSVGFLEILVPILMTIVAALSTAFLSIRRLFVGSGDGGLGVEQRDGFAFLLGLNGFTEEARELRQSNRQYSWWTLSDALAERLLHADPLDLDGIKRGMDVLNALVSHQHQMTNASKAIVHTNLARLAEASGDTLSATQHIQFAFKVDKKTTHLRNGAIPVLKKLTKGHAVEQSAGLQLREPK
ncbi:MAG: hypothetical protein ABL888_00635 [Pirellulaceae bacterium]